MTVWAWQSYYSTRREPKPSKGVMAAVPLIKAAEEAGEDYGACHIVLADINLEKRHIRWCAAQPDITVAGAAAMQAMLALTMRDRAIAVCLVNGESFHPWSDDEWAQFDHSDD